MLSCALLRRPCSRISLRIKSIELAIGCWQEPDGQWWRRVEAAGAAVWGPCDRQNEPELLVDIAYFLQDHVFDTEPWGEARPICPGHPHPPNPRIVDGVAAWICPRTGRVVAPIGRLSDGN